MAKAAANSLDIESAPAPDPQEVLFFAKPSMRRALFFSYIYVGFLFFARSIIGFDSDLLPIWLFCFGLLFALLGVIYLKCRTTRYAITGAEVQSYSGVIARRVIIESVERVTKGEVLQTVLDRLLGTCNLRIDAPGGEAKAMVMERILKRDADELVEIIRALRGTSPGGTGLRPKIKNF